jgi:hypothetical protein
MKSAEEIAKGLASEQLTPVSWKRIAQALTAYADERVDEAEIEWLKNWNPQYEADLKQARAEALEEAARICDGYSQFRYSADTMVEAENMANDIRALKATSPQINPK